MHFTVLHALFLTCFLDIFVKAQQAASCPATACYTSDSPCTSDNECETGTQCCLIEGVKCCKAPSVPTTSTPQPEGTCPTTACSFDERPCKQDNDCSTGSLCCAIEGLQCCKVSPGPPPPPPPGCVCPNTTCTLRDNACTKDEECGTGSLCCNIQGIRCCKAGTSPPSGVCTCGIADFPCQGGTCSTGTSCCRDASNGINCCRPVVPTPDCTTTPTTTQVTPPVCNVSNPPCHYDTDCQTNKKCVRDKNNLECCI